MGNIAAFLLALAIVGLVVEMLRRKKLREKYAALWLIVGVQLPSNLLFAMSILMLLGVCLHLSWEISVVEDETRTLAEEVAILRVQVEALSTAASTDSQVPSDSLATTPDTAGPHAAKPDTQHKGSD